MTTIQISRHFFECIQSADPSKSVGDWLPYVFEKDDQTGECRDSSEVDLATQPHRGVIWYYGNRLCAYRGQSPLWTQARSYVVQLECRIH